MFLPDKGVWRGSPVTGTSYVVLCCAVLVRNGVQNVHIICCFVVAKMMPSMEMKY